MCLFLDIIGKYIDDNLESLRQSVLLSLCQQHESIGESMQMDEAEKEPAYNVIDDNELIDSGFIVKMNKDK